MFSNCASKAHDDLLNNQAIDIHYCTYEDFLTAKIPLNTFCLVDEIDSLFFADSPNLDGNKFISSVLLLNKYRVIGMSATFRGQQGLKYLKLFLKGNTIIQTSTVVPERILDFDVFGKLTAT